MNKLYSVRGRLDPDFIGQITYTISLEATYNALDICLKIDEKQRCYSEEEITADLVQDVREQFIRETGMSIDDETLMENIHGMKAEIHTIATLNDEFIGGIHRQLAERHMYFDAAHATEGCIPQSEIRGVLKVTILVFNVLKPDTDYTLTVCAE